MRIVLVLVSLLLIGGCKKGYDQKAMGQLTASEQKIVGKYKYEIDFNVGNGEGSAELKQLIGIIETLDGGSDTSLECFPEKKFVMTAGELPVTGEWNLTDTTLKLRINKVGDQKPDEISKSQLKSRGLSGWTMNPAQRDEFLKTYGGAIALEQAENMATMRVSPDGTRYGVSPQNSLFGSLVSFFKKVKE